MSDNLLTQEEFNEITKDFKRTILHNDGLYRHIRYRHPRESNMYWAVITYPGGCTIRGDYGQAFTMEREQDMLTEFLRGRRINPQYWQGKVVSGRAQCREYTEAAMRRDLRGLVETAAEGFHACVERKDNPDLLKETQDEIVDQFMGLVEHSGDGAIWDVINGSIGNEFEELKDCNCDEGNGWDWEIALPDLCEDWWDGFDPTEYTYEFLYACYALQKTANDWVKDGATNE